MKGRKHIPDKIKQLKGTLQPCRVVVTDIKGVLGSLPEFPDKFGREAKEIYQVDGMFLISMGLLTVMNLRIFTSYCRKLVKHEQLLDLIDECHDLDMRIKLERISKELWNQIVATARDFALQPVYWNKINTKEKKKESEFGNFMNGKS